jgi:hypothetical protein
LLHLWDENSLPESLFLADYQLQILQQIRLLRNFYNDAQAHDEIQAQSPRRASGV